MSDRDAFREARDAGLAKRHETREARAVRKAVAEEIYEALKKRREEAREDQQRGWPLLSEAMVITREIGSRDPA